MKIKAHYVHKWNDIYGTYTYRIGLWFKMFETVGKRNFSNPNKWDEDLIPSYLIGIDLIVVSFWIEFGPSGAMEIEI